jgi:branched-chain amino acid transport system substrate-binding protein
MQPFYNLVTRSATFGMTLLLFFFVACQQQLMQSSSPPVDTPAPTAVAVAMVVTPPPTQVPQTTLLPQPAGCNRSQRDHAEVVVGALYPLSTLNIMINGFAMQAATNLAVTEINAKGGIGGKPLRVITYDSSSSPAQGALFAERLITLDCVVALLGVFHSDVAMAVKEVAVQYHIPVIFADPYEDELTADQAPEVFRIAPTRSMFTAMMGEWLAEVGDYNQDGELSAVLLTENRPAGLSRIERAQRLLPNYGVTLEAIAVDLPATDFSSTIARIVALPTLPDAIFLYIHDPATLQLQQALLEANIGPKRDTLLVTLIMALDEQQFWQEVPDGNYTVALQVGPWLSTVPPMGQHFAQQFGQYFQRWPEAAAFEAYDAVWLMADAIERADTTDADEIISALEKTDLTLAAGHYTFPYGAANPPDGQKVPAYMWHQWPDPPLLYLQYTEPNQSAKKSTVIWPATYRTIDGPLAPALLEELSHIGRRW